MNLYMNLSDSKDLYHYEKKDKPKIQTCERKYAFESKYLNTYKVLKFSETHGRLDGKVIQQN